MKVLIVEDEKLSAQKLMSMLSKSDFDIEVIGITSSIESTKNFIEDNKIDLIFLDIQLEDGLSFEIFEGLEIDIPIIFTTAYDEYALKAFELNSIDYLLKPIKQKNLNFSLNKLKKRSDNFYDYDKLLKLLKPKEYKKRFIVNIGQKIKFINSEDIAYIYADNKMVFLVTFDDNKYLIDDTIENISYELNPDLFFRINRKFIININSIQNMISLSRTRIKIDLKPQLRELEAIVSIEKSQDFKKWLNK